MSFTSRALRSALILLVAVAAMAAALVATGSGHQAKANSPGWLYSFVDYNTSQSNILFSFISDTGTVIQQTIERGQCGGEKAAYIPPVDVPCYKQGFGYEPLRMWVNAHWCGGVQYILYDKATGANRGLDSQWYYFSGGSGGQSVPIQRATLSSDAQEIKTYLVPNGYAGCVA